MSSLIWARYNESNLAAVQRALILQRDDTYTLDGNKSDCVTHLFDFFSELISQTRRIDIFHAKLFELKV